MSATGKKYFSDDFKKTIWGKFADEIRKAKSDEEIIELINRIMSPQERINYEKRLAALYLLSQGSTYRKIGEILDIQGHMISYLKKGFIKKKRVKKTYSSSSRKKEPLDFLFEEPKINLFGKRLYHRRKTK